MEYRQAMVTPAAAHRDLMRLLPQLRDAVDTAVVRMQQAGDDPLALEGVRAVLQRLQSGFRFLGVAELERFSEEVDAGFDRLLDAWADPYADPEDCQRLRHSLLHSLLGWNDILEDVAAGHDPISDIAAAIDSLRCARGAPRYDSLALLRHCVDAQAPYGWVEDPSALVARARWPYQIGLLELLRGNEHRGLSALQNILLPLERALGDSAAGAACWLALGVIEALAEGGALETADKRSLVAFDRELRRLAQGGNTSGLPACSLHEVMFSRVRVAPVVVGRVAELKHSLMRMPRTELALPDSSGTSAEAVGRQIFLPADLGPEDEPSVELQELFYEEVEPALAQLGTALKRWRHGDVQAGLTIQRILHNLKRSAGLAGLQGFADHCREIEHEVAAALADGFDQHSAERLRTSLESLAEELDRLRHALHGSKSLPPGDGGEQGHAGSCEAVPSEEVTAGVREIQPQLLGLLGAVYEQLLDSIEQVAAEYQRAVDLEVAAEEGRLSTAAVVNICNVLKPLTVNAVIHGIGSAQRRLQQGKSGRGTLRLRAWREASELLITVSDDGGGLDLTGLQRLLSDYDPEEPLAELSNDEALSLIALPGVSLATDQDYSDLPGEGMGEALEASRELDGVLELETIPGSGTTFTLRLPAMEVLSGDGPADEQASVEPERQRALIVNDSRTLRRITAYLIGYQRFTMLEANSLAEAVMLARSHQPDVVVIDVQMGWGDAGLDALRRLEEEAGVAVQQVVAVTTVERDRQRLEERGMEPAALLIEPYSREQLAEAIERALVKAQ
ncbi:response regulator [Halorhodospira halochloris]|nr:response regulator [Halorhodospira halochloris]MBK1651076.1 hypothetical protein [Halorhodospira halochloris]